MNRRSMINSHRLRDPLPSSPMRQEYPTLDDALKAFATSQLRSSALRRTDAGSQKKHALAAITSASDKNVPRHRSHFRFYSPDRNNLRALPRLVAPKTLSEPCLAAAWAALNPTWTVSSSWVKGQGWTN